MHKRLIRPNEKAIYRIFNFRSDLAAHRYEHQHWDEGDAEDGAEEHSEGFRERERLEQPPCLRRQGEDRDEADGDHQQRKEQWPSDTFRGSDDDFDAFGVGGIAPFLLAEMLEKFVGVLDHDDG